MASGLSLDDFDKHIAHLHSQLQFLNQALEATDHNAPDWLATDLISLRNKSGRLQDDMQRFKDQLESEGLGVRKVSNKRLSLEGADHPSEKRKRLSIEGAQPSTSSENTMLRKNTPGTSVPPDNPLVNPAVSSQPSSDAYQEQHLDVSDEINRRLNESRLRRLMNSPPTSQKRKYDVFEDVRMGNGPDAEENKEEEKERSEGGSAKRLRASGTFGGDRLIEGVLKRKDDTVGRSEKGAGSKRRRI